jgi:hypothetical protein
MNHTPEDQNGSNVDDRIDHVLRGLGDAEAPPGMERRILTSLTAHEAATSSASAESPRGRLLTRLTTRFGGNPLAPRTMPRSMAPLWTLSLALTAVAAVVLAVLLPQHSTHPAAHSTLAETVQPQPTQPVQAVPAPSPTPSPAPHTVAAKASLRRPANNPPMHPSPLLSADDLRSLRELHTPSHPAPPAPLTAAEKALQRIALHPEPQQLAMLDPEMRAREQASSAAEFEHFVHRSADNQPSTSPNPVNNPVTNP